MVKVSLAPPLQIPPPDPAHRTDYDCLPVRRPGGSRAPGGQELPGRPAAAAGGPEPGEGAEGGPAAVGRAEPTEGIAKLSLGPGEQVSASRQGQPGVNLSFIIHLS